MGHRRLLARRFWTRIGETLLPDFLTTNATLRSGERVTIRPMHSEDSSRFAEYLRCLSAETRARYGPHPFDRVTAEAICAALDPTDILRMAVTFDNDGEEHLIAYFLL